MNPREFTRLAVAVPLLGAAALFCAPRPAAAGGPGSSAVQVLKTDMSPRAAGMAGAFVAVVDDVYSLAYNPAGLGQLYVPEASAMYLSGFDDASLNYLAAGSPLPFLGLAGFSRPGVGLALMMSDAGSFRYNLINSDGSVFSRDFDAQKDLALTAGYGEKVYSGVVNLEGYKARIDQYLGVNVKYVRSTILEDSSPPSTLAFDAGWLLLEPHLGLSLGASLSNAGSGLKYGSETAPLPAILRLGAAWQKPTVMDQSVLLAAESDFYTNESLKSLRFGMEYHFQRVFNLRLGYRAAEDNNGMTLGFGLHYGDMALDFATGLDNAVYNSTLLSFSYKFSGLVLNEYRKKASYKAAPAGTTPAKTAPRAPARTAPATEKKKDSDFFWLY
jgi:hypothetical protein